MIHFFLLIENGGSMVILHTSENIFVETYQIRLYITPTNRPYIKKRGGLLRPSSIVVTAHDCVYLELLIKSTIALNASGWLVAKSAKAFRFSAIPLLWISPMKAE